MGLCFSCSKSKDRFRDKGQKICGHIQSAVSPLHVSHEAAGAAVHQHLHHLHHHLHCNGQGHVNGGAPLIPTPSLQLQSQPPPSPGGPPPYAPHRLHVAAQPPGACAPHSASMATSFTNMNITNPIKGLVSKNRNRYKKDGFDLDLTYITDNIIAMGYPASKIEGVYRNHIDDVVKFLDRKHRDHYFIYNLCSERCYDRSKFHHRVELFAFDDHNPPRLEIIAPFCESVHRWLTQDADNVAVVHCKAGKGRTGTMICCYLLHSRLSATADEALSFYGRARTQDRKGVTIPSQVRYVRYYEKMIDGKLTYRPVSMYVKDIILQPVPVFPPGSTIYFKVYTHGGVVGVGVGGVASGGVASADGGGGATQPCKMLHKSEPCELRRGDGKLVMPLDVCVPLTGDIKVEFCVKSLVLQKTKKFHMWFNTFFVDQEQQTDLNGFVVEQNGGGGGGVGGGGVGAGCGMMGGGGGARGDKTYVMSFRKSEIDTIHKSDKQHKVYSADFVITLFMQKIPTSEMFPPSYVREPPSSLQDTPNESSDSSEEYSNDEDDWDSGESTYL